MVARCIAAGCSNARSDTVSLFRFPKDPALRLRWIKQIKRTRAKWTGPTDRSVLCSKHFTEDCFEPTSALGASFGLKMRLKLKPDAVPTIFERESSSTQTEEPSTSGRPAAQKRPSATESDGATKKRRSAYEKRERSRVR